MTDLAHALAVFKTVKTQLKEVIPDIDETTLSDTVEGLTDLHDVIAMIVRSAVYDEALAQGLKTRIKDMQERLARFEQRAAKYRQICRTAMAEAEIKKIAADDLTISLRMGMPSLIIIDEKVIPSDFWEPQPPRLKRQEIIVELKHDRNVPGTELARPEAILSVRSK